MLIEDTAIKQLKHAIDTADAIVIGAGAGLSASAGFTYSGERFKKYFSDLEEKFGYHDMYSGGFYPYSDEAEKWAFWSRNIYYNRYVPTPKPVYDNLLKLIKDKNYFVITTNVDHCFQKAGFDKQRLLYTQGDYGLFQCKTPCHAETYDNEEQVRQMLAEQKDMKVPRELIPRCPRCGGPMELNLRCDDTFVQDEGWYLAAERYSNFIKNNCSGKVIFLELGVGYNTPGIIKYPFWRMTRDNPNAVYALINLGQAAVPKEIATRSVCLDADIGAVLEQLLQPNT